MSARDEHPPVPLSAGRRALSLPAALLAWSMLALACIALLGSSTWLGAMLANVSTPLAFVALIVSVFALTARRYATLFVGLVATAALVAPALTVPRADDGAKADARVLVFNVYAEATDHRRTLAMLREVDADLILLNECTHEFSMRLEADEAISAKYPYRELPEHTKQWARGVLSVWPIERLDTLEGEADFSRREALKFRYLARRAQLVRHPETPFLAGVTIFESPRGPARWRTGNLTMHNDASLIRESLLSRGIPLVLGIDMNATPASPRSRRFLRETGLARAKPLLEFSGTWPASAPPILRVPIDDLFMSQGVRVVSWEVIEDQTDSDHAPVMVTIDLPDSG